MLTVPWLTARETAALIVVAVSLLFFRVFRERCLLAWGAGWLAYGAFLWVTGAGESHAASKCDGGIRAGRLCAGDGFVCGGGADVGAGAARADCVGGGLVGADGLRRHAAAVFSADSKTLGTGVGCSLPADCRRGSRRTVALPVRADWAGAFPVRRRAADLEFDWPPFTSHIPSEGYLLAEVLFGSSILLVVLDDSRVRTRRLAVLNELAVTIARGQNHVPDDADRAGKTESRSGGEGGVVPV